jgi:hypothetical protein
MYGKCFEFVNGNSALARQFWGQAPTGVFKHLKKDLTQFEYNEQYHVLASLGTDTEIVLCANDQRQVECMAVYDVCPTRVDVQTNECQRCRC